MLRGLIRFHLGLLRMPRLWQAWVLLLVLVNMVIPMFFLAYTEAVVTIAAMLAAAMLMGWLTAKTGFSRLLGLGHIIFWVPLLVYLGMQLPLWPATETFGLWLRVVLLLNAVSLLIDAVDVLRYLRGERDETVTGLRD